MAHGKSLELAEIKPTPPTALDGEDVKAEPSKRRIQRALRRAALGPQGFHAGRRTSSRPTGPGALTRHHVEVSETPGIPPLFFMARPFPVRRPRDWGAHKALLAAQGRPPAAPKTPAEPKTYGRRHLHYQEQNGDGCSITPRQRKRLRQKQNRVGLRQRRSAGLAA